MNVSWEYTGYKCKYLIIEADGTKIECDENQRKVKMQRFRFPSDADRFELYILPYNMPFTEYEKGHSISADMIWDDGRQISMNPPSAWNIQKDEYYYLYQDEMSVYSISNFKKQSDYLLREIIYFDMMYMSASAKTSQIAIYKYKYPKPVSTYELFIYNDNEFEDPLHIENINIYNNPIYLCDNYTLFYYDTFWLGDTNYETNSIIIDSKTGDEILRKKLQNRDSKIAVSSDGKYFCDYYKSHLIIYEVQNNNAIQIYSYTNLDYRYVSCQFSHINPNELILSGEDNTVVFDLNNLTPIYQTKGFFIAQDPVTGNIACLDQYFSKNSILNIYDKTLSNKLTKIPFSYSEYDSYYLFNNRLICQSFTTTSIDISNYIK